MRSFLGNLLFIRHGAKRSVLVFHKFREQAPSLRFGVGLKEKLHFKVFPPPYVNEKDIWWVSLGENVGFEINGKSSLFSRPVIVLKKLSHMFYFVIPTTTQHRKGSWYVGFPQHSHIVTACLHQARTIDYRRLYSKLSELYDHDFVRVKKSFEKLYL